MAESPWRMPPEGTACCLVCEWIQSGRSVSILAVEHVAWSGHPVQVGTLGGRGATITPAVLDRPAFTNPDN